MDYLEILKNVLKDKFDIMTYFEKITLIAAYTFFVKKTEKGAKRPLFKCLIISINSDPTPTQLRTNSYPCPTTVGDDTAEVRRWEGDGGKHRAVRVVKRRWVLNFVKGEIAGRILCL